MHELISQPGLRFYLFQLNGTIKYTLTRNGITSQPHYLSDVDLADKDPDSGTGDDAPEPEDGPHARTVRFAVKLIMNNGILWMQYAAKGEACAEWTFDGLVEMHRRAFSASCTLTGMKLENENQNEKVGAKMVQTDLTMKDMDAKDMDCAPLDLPAALHNTADEDEGKGGSESETEPEDEIDTEACLGAWARHIYFTSTKLGGRDATRRGDLHIDRLTHTVHWEEQSGEVHNRKTTKERLDLRDSNTKAQFETDAYTSLLTVWHPQFTKDGVKKNFIVQLQTLHPSDIWGSNDETSNTEDHIREYYIHDVRVLLEELLLCIDKTSSRASSVPNPRTVHLYSHADEVPGDPLSPIVLVPARTWPRPDDSKAAKKRRRVDEESRIDGVVELLDIDIDKDPFLSKWRKRIRRVRRVRRRAASEEAEMDLQGWIQARKITLRGDARRIARERTYL